MRRVYWLLFIGCLGLAGTAAAENVYKYSKDGKVIYSDQPPPSSNATKLDSYSSTKPAARPANESAAPQDPLDRTALRSQECNKARERIKKYQDSPTMVQRNLKGEETTLSAEQRIDMIVRAQQDVTDLCSAPTESDDVSDEIDVDRDDNEGESEANS